MHAAMSAKPAVKDSPGLLPRYASSVVGSSRSAGIFPFTLPAIVSGNSAENPAGQRTDGAEPMVEPTCNKPLSTAVDELFNSKVKIISEDKED